MKKIFSKELIIGVTVLITLLILYFGIEFLKGMNIFHSANYYYTTYTNVAGLAQSAPVTVNGFKVGQVKEIKYEYDNPGHVRVELSLDKNLKVPRGSQAILVTDMLGTSTIELHMAANNDFHTVGEDLVGVCQPGLMDGLKGDMLPAIGQLIPHVDSLVVSVTALTTDPALLNSIQRLDAVMANLEASTTQLSAAMKQLPTIMTDAKGTMANANTLTTNLAQISEDLKAVSAQLKDMPLDDTVDNIHSITQNLDKIIAQLNSKDSSLGLLMNDPQLYDNLNNTAAHLDSILIDLKRQPKKYIPAIKVF